MVHQCEGSYILFGAGIRDDHVYVFNVTNPTNWTELTRFYGTLLFVNFLLPKNIKAVREAHIMFGLTKTARQCM